MASRVSSPTSPPTSEQAPTIRRRCGGCTSRRETKSRHTNDAREAVRTRGNEGRNWVVDADSSAYFDSIDKGKLMAMVAERISDRKVLRNKPAKRRCCAKSIAMRLFVTGASSFVGAHFSSLASRQGFVVHGLHRRTPLALRGVVSVLGDVADARPSAGTEVVVHLATKVMAPDAREQNRRMLDGVLSWGLPVVYASSTVVHWPRQNAYSASRIEDERRVRESGLPYLIVRPCAPYGPRHPEHQPRHKESFHTLARMCRSLPAVPVMGDGHYRRQPIHVDDFNGAILRLLRAGVWGRAFDGGGPEAMSLRAIIAALGGRHVLPIPSRLLRVGGPFVGLSRDAISTFDTDDVVDTRPLEAACGLAPRPFDPGALANV
ncbi:MAG: NAD-dependent epimerase/dehydratase family protein [Myxococcales bacterium]|nr:NAD-dependent epimerase/dehydratase family protein [Myxococcales bacterium]